MPFLQIQNITVFPKYHTSPGNHMDEVPGGCKLPTERATKHCEGINVKFLVTLEMQVQTAPHHHPLPQREM